MNGLSEEYELIVAGEVYGSFDKYEQIIDEAGLKQRIHLFNQYIPDSEVTNYFSAAEVCILPYKGATQSGITAIAHHFDLPIIATDVGGLKETVQHEKTGLIIQPDSSELREAITLIFKENRISEFRKNIQEYKNENSWPNFAKKVLEFSKEL